MNFADLHSARRLAAPKVSVAYVVLNMRIKLFDFVRPTAIPDTVFKYFGVMVHKLMDIYRHSVICADIQKVPYGGSDSVA